MISTDLIIIGAGPGGYRAAELAAKAGLKVVVFEGSEVGGTCLNVGCIPTKTYVHSASFAEARERMPQVVEQLRSGVESILTHPNITLVREKGVFVDAHTVNDYTAKNIIIATGSETKWLPIKGLDDPRVVDSTGLLNLDTLPKRLVIIGAGVIGMEFASVFHRFGSEVTVIEFLKECLPALDSDIAKRLRKYLEKQGITFKMKTAVENIADIDADVILMATGRKPRTEGLGLEKIGVTLAPNGAIPVDDNYHLSLGADRPIVNCQLSIINSLQAKRPFGPSDQFSNIYAIGDVNGRQMLAHAAEFQAKYVIDSIVNGNNAQSDSSLLTLHSPLSSCPAAIFTTPEAACVGPSEDQLKEQGMAYECRKAFYRSNGKALAMGETEGMLKLFSESDAGRILGCHAYGAHAADMIQEVSVLMSCGATIKQLRNMVHIHPTVNEVLLSAAEQL